MMMLLQQAVTLGAVRALDYQFARLVAGDHQPLLAMLAVSLSVEASTGNVCLPLRNVTQERILAGRQPELASRIWLSAGEPGLAEYLQVLQASPAVSDGTRPTPLVLQGERLYLQRMWQDEGQVAAFLLGNSGLTEQQHGALPGILDQLFGPVGVATDWQKVAAAVAATRQVSVISGGPGTGKTTTVARLLAALIRLAAGRKLRIQLAAPTGKAAARLTESLGQVMPQLRLSKAEIALFPTETSTLHRLLGAQPNTVRLRYHAGNPLHLDVLVVDEASMVDLTMMARVIAALPMGARLILLGDRDQLASVEAGAVLGDICWFSQWGFSPQRAAELTRLTGYSLVGQQQLEDASVRDSLCLLQKSYRFDAHSGIGQLAMAVNQGKGQQALKCLQQGFADIDYYPLQDSDDYVRVLQMCVAGYRDYLQQVQQGRSAAEVLTAFGHFQLLSALRSGPFGVSGLNERIEQVLVRMGLITRPAGNAGCWYPGRPVMIRRNDSSLGLFNGDIGIALRNAAGELRVHFFLPDGTVKSVQPNRLPEHETAYAMTVHKSQGSEFRHTLLVLPDQYSPLLSRELVYTAITRAREHLTLCCVERVFIAAIHARTERSSGLVDRLLQGSASGAERQRRQE